MNAYKLDKQIDFISEFIRNQAVLTKQILSLEEAAIYMSVSKSYLYKLTSKREIPFYRPGAKLIFFKREELDAWILGHRNAPVTELSLIESKRK